MSPEEIKAVVDASVQQTAPSIPTIAFAFVLGIIATLIGFIIQELWRTYRRRRSIAIALLAEAKSARSRYMVLIGNNFEATAESELPTRRATFREYQVLPVFEAHLGELGIFPKSDAESLARVYTEASGFIQTLRNFLAGMDRLDEINSRISRTPPGEGRQAMVDEATALKTHQLQFWGELRAEHFRVTQELFDELEAVLTKFIVPNPDLINPFQSV